MRHSCIKLNKFTFSGKFFSKCGKCRRYMTLIASRPVRLYCKNCEEAYSLPQVREIFPMIVFNLTCLSGRGHQTISGKCLPARRLRIGAVLQRQSQCPQSNFSDFVISFIGKSIPICPYCYNHPPFENISSGSLILFLITFTLRIQHTHSFTHAPSTDPPSVCPAMTAHIRRANIPSFAMQSVRVQMWSAAR